ncbi:MAG TPA: FHA domain-containing protein [Solirubrobacteraceae bacterium]|nr:FHA domain-containing protein [Solirubrobacteraceae bacterium]
MDTAPRLRDTHWVLGPGARRHRLARTLNAAYAEGLLSERTLAHRLDALFAGGLIDPARLVGDLTRRRTRRPLNESVLASVISLLQRLRGGASADADEPGILLALDWTGGCEDLVIGRHPSCDVVVDDETVSRRHAQLTFRDGGWVLQDLRSTNGTRVNGQYVGRCRLRPGDQLGLGYQLLRVD